MTRAAERRARLAVERTQLRLKTERLEVERERRALHRERAEAIVFLRLLCERYGDLHWTEDDSLLTILEAHLAAPLAEHMTALLEQVAELQQASRHLDRRPTAEVREPDPRRTRAPSPPAPPPPTPPPCALLQLRVDSDGRPGHQVRCQCGWQTAVCPSDIEARLAGTRHLQGDTARPDRPPTPRARPEEPRRHRYA